MELVLATGGGVQAIGPWPLYILIAIVLGVICYLLAKRQDKS